MRPKQLLLLSKCFSNKTRCEKLSWMVYIFLTQVVMVLLIYIYVRSLDKYDIQTALSLRPTSDIPFPAVTISPKNTMVDPMGYVKRSGNTVGREKLPEKGMFSGEIFSQETCYRCLIRAMIHDNPPMRSPVQACHRT